MTTNLTAAQRRNIRKWVKALRSGNYRRGTSQLHKPYWDDQYCCLGVACEALKIKYRDTAQYLPRTAQQLLGLPRDPVLDGQSITATYVNDVLGVPFGEIATLLENRYLREQE